MAVDEHQNQSKSEPIESVLRAEELEDNNNNSGRSNQALIQYQSESRDLGDQRRCVIENELPDSSIHLVYSENCQTLVVRSLQVNNLEPKLPPLQLLQQIDNELQRTPMFWPKGPTEFLDHLIKRRHGVEYLLISRGTQT